MFFIDFSNENNALEFAVLRKIGDVDVEVKTVYRMQEKRFIAEIQDVKALIHWLDKLDYQLGKKLYFRNVSLSFEYGHFEKGEAYYQIVYDGNRINLFEQLGGTNVFKAKKLREELESALTP